jgi:alpha-L-arabinofuranosidase
MLRAAASLSARDITMRSAVGWWVSILLLGIMVLGAPLAPGGEQKSKAPESIIAVHAGKPAGRVSRYLTGACIEDVNHEIYGGIYSQMIFGESFQEPAFQQPLAEFTAYGGSWKLDGDNLIAGGGNGPKLVSDHPPVAKAEVGAEVLFTDRTGGNAGLIVKTHRPGVGADNFDGYEVSLDPSAQILRLGRHRHSWEPIKDTPCTVGIGEWIRLAVRMTENSLTVLVNDKQIMTYEDRQHPLKKGGFGLRQWQRPARYRTLWVKTNGKTEPVPFKANAEDVGAVSGMWRACRRGTASGKCELVKDCPFVGGQSQKVTFLAGEGSFGVENGGLNRWGLSFVGGKAYEGYLWARAGKPTQVSLTLQSHDGKNIGARANLRVSSKVWQRLSFSLTADRNETSGRFVVQLERPGSVELGHVFLQPGEWGRFKKLPLRRDVVEAMIDQGLTVLRYGGSMVNCPEYRWKKMFGPRDRRPPYKGTWYPYSSNGWGIIDFLNLCEAAGFLAIPAFCMDETPRDMADFVAYINGPAESEWGKKRTTDGHPAPYRLKYLELGNEEKIDDDYVRRFKAIAQAIWAVDPGVILVVGDFVYSQPITDPDRIKGAASGITSMAGHRKILEFARRRGKEVWFDIHIGTEHPGALRELAVVPTYIDALATISGGAKHKVVVFELNAGNHAQRRALANAIAIGALHQLGEKVPIVCSANALQPDGQNDNGWDQGLLFLNPSRVWLQPPGFVTRLIAHRYQPVQLAVQVTGRPGLQVAAARSEDGKTLVLRVVNASDRPVLAQLAINRFKAASPIATVEELAGPLDAVNTAKEPRQIAPVTGRWRHELGEAPSRYSFPARSFSVVTFE